MSSIASWKRCVRSSLTGGQWPSVNWHLYSKGRSLVDEVNVGGMQTDSLRPCPIQNEPVSEQRQVNELVNCYMFMMKTLHYVLGMGLYTEREKVEMCKGISRLVNAGADEPGTKCRLDAFLKQYGLAWNHHLKKIMLIYRPDKILTNISVLVRMTEDILNPIWHDYLPGELHAGDPDAERVSCLFRWLQEVSTSVSVCMRGGKLHPVCTLQKAVFNLLTSIPTCDVIKSRLTLRNAVNLAMHLRFIYRMTLELKFMLLANHVVPIVDGALDILSTRPCVEDYPDKVSSGPIWVDDVLGDLIFTVGDETPFLKSFVEFQQNLDVSDDVDVIFEKMEKFLAQVEEIPALGLEPVLMSLYFSFKRLQIMLRNGTLVEHVMEMSEAIEGIIGNMSTVVDEFLNAVGKPIQMNFVRDFLIFNVRRFQNKLDTDRLRDHLYAVGIDLNELASVVSRIMSDLEIVDSTICVVMQIQKACQVQMFTRQWRCPVFDLCFYKVPEVVGHYITDTPKAEPQIEPWLMELLQETAKLLQDKGFAIDVPSDKAHMNIPDISDLLSELMSSNFHSKECIVRDVPVMTDRDAFQMWLYFVKERANGSDPERKCESAAEILYKLHFFFMLIEGLGWQSYSNACLLMYLRAASKLLFGQDILEGQNLFSPLDKSVLSRLTETWNNYLQNGSLLNVWVSLGRARLAFGPVLDYVMDHAGGGNLVPFVYWFMNVLNENPTESDINVFRELMQRLDVESVPLFQETFALFSEAIETEKLATEGDWMIELMSTVCQGSASELKSERLATYAGVFIQLLKKCCDDETVSCDPIALTMMEQSSPSDFQESLRHLHESLECGTDILLIINEDVIELGDYDLFETFTVIYTGGLCEERLSKLIDQANNIADGSCKQQLLHDLKLLATLLAFFRVRDRLCADMEDLNFSMLRQFNLKSFTNLGYSFFFLTGAIDHTASRAEKLDELSKQLLQLGEGLPITQPAPCDEDMIVQTYCEMCMFLDIDTFKVRKVLESLVRLMGRTVSVDFATTFWSHIGLQLKNLSPSDDSIRACYTFLTSHCGPEDYKAFGCQINLILMILALQNLRRPLLSFHFNKSASAIDHDPPLFMKMAMDDQNRLVLEMPMQYALSGSSIGVAMYRSKCEDGFPLGRLSEKLLAIEKERGKSTGEQSDDHMTTEASDPDNIAQTLSGSDARALLSCVKSLGAEIERTEKRYTESVQLARRTHVAVAKKFVHECASLEDPHRFAVQASDDQDPYALVTQYQEQDPLFNEEIAQKMVSSVVDTDINMAVNRLNAVRKENEALKLVNRTLQSLLKKGHVDPAAVTSVEERTSVSTVTLPKTQMYAGVELLVNPTPAPVSYDAVLMSSTPRCLATSSGEFTPDVPAEVLQGGVTIPKCCEQTLAQVGTWGQHNHRQKSKPSKRVKPEQLIDRSGPSVSAVEKYYLKYKAMGLETRFQEAVKQAMRLLVGTNAPGQRSTTDGTPASRVSRRWKSTEDRKTPTIGSLEERILNPPSVPRDTHKKTPENPKVGVRTSPRHKPNVQQADPNVKKAEQQEMKSHPDVQQEAAGGPGDDEIAQSGVAGELWESLNSGKHGKELLALYSKVFSDGHTPNAEEISKLSKYLNEEEEEHADEGEEEEESGDERTDDEDNDDVGGLKHSEIVAPETLMELCTKDMQ